MPQATDRTGPRSGRRVLPPEALASLREAFAGEVAARLPLLKALTGRDDADTRAEALRAAHALGSSAVVVGEPEASRAARAVEAALLELAPEAPLPAAVTDGVAALAALLAPWQER